MSIFNEIACLNIRYYEMKTAENRIDKYDDGDEYNQQIRDHFVKCYEVNKQSFDEQNKKVHDMLSALPIDEKELEKTITKVVNYQMCFGTKEETKIKGITDNIISIMKQLWKRI